MTTCDLYVDVRCRRLWLLRVAKYIPGSLMSRRVYHAIVQWLWARVRFEYRSGGVWRRIPQPALRIDR
jgi:hypothetical protein